MKLKYHWDTGEVEWINPGLCFIDDPEPEPEPTPEPEPEPSPEPEPEPAPAKWYGELDEDLAKTADRFTDLSAMTRAVMDLRARESQVRVPGKDASEEEVSAYHKAIGVPDAETPYEWTDVEGVEVTEEIAADRAKVDEAFRAAGITADQGKVIGEVFANWQQEQMAAANAADAAFAEAGEAANKQEWGAEYDANITAGNNAFKAVADRAGLDVEELRHIEMKDGRYLMDHPSMARIFATIGKEMSSGRLEDLGGITEGERETLDNQIAELQTQMREASDAGDHKKANALYAKEQALIAKRDGNRLITA